MAKRKRRAKRRRQPPPSGRGYGWYAKEIISGLERVCGLSGRRPGDVFHDWVALVEATLEMLPDHLAALGRSGQLAPDRPETARRIAQIRTPYDLQGRDRFERVWTEFGRAFALLLDGAAPGLWGPPAGEASMMGPDILGEIFTRFAPSLGRGHRMILTPWAVARLKSRLIIGSAGPAEVYDRLKKACQHPDNVLAQATLLAGLAIEEPAEARAWFLSRVVPAALSGGHYEPVTILDPAVGSGTLLMAAAIQYEPWMVHCNLVQFFGQDVSLLATEMARCSLKLYGLNGYYLKLMAAAQAIGDPEAAAEGPLPHSARAAYQQAVAGGQAAPQPDGPAAAPSFEQLFRQSTAEPTP